MQVYLTVFIGVYLVADTDRHTHAEYLDGVSELSRSDGER